MYISNTNCKPSLLLNNVCLAVVDEVNYLGVVIDSHLTFHTHIRKNIVRASIRANLIHKCFISCDAFTLIRAFKVYVRPTLEYASCTWSHHHIHKNTTSWNCAKEIYQVTTWVRVTMLQGEVVSSWFWYPGNASVGARFVVHLQNCMS